LNFSSILGLTIQPKETCLFGTVEKPETLKNCFRMKPTTIFKQSILNFLLAPFSWTRWVDIDTFSYSSEAYLLQAKKNRKTNAKQFRVTSTSPSFFTNAAVRQLPFEDLKKANLIETELAPGEIKITPTAD
jgi:hypothetical protein